ncbi:hypothetical protein ES703_38371 [subsurface metagenome]
MIGKDRQSKTCKKRSKTFKNIQKRSNFRVETFENIQKYSKIFKNVQRIDTNLLDADFATTKAQKHEKKSVADSAVAQGYGGQVPRLTRICFGK